jgi:hypothetical protein
MGAMTGHSPLATVKAVEEQARRRITLMLPGEDSIFVAEELQKRFQLPYWQFRSPLPMRIAFRFARRGRLRGGRRFWCSTGAITAPWMRRRSLWNLTARPGRGAGTLVRQ